MKKRVTDSKNLLTDEGCEALLTVASLFECECPKHLISILKQVRGFTAYEKKCINLSPKDMITHEWLLGQSEHLETEVSSIILKLATRENMIDDDHCLIET